MKVTALAEIGKPLLEDEVGDSSSLLWEGQWKLDKNYDVKTGEGGWSYAMDFWLLSKGHAEELDMSEAKMGCLARRRRWLRRLRRVSKEDAEKAAAKEAALAARKAAAARVALPEEYEKKQPDRENSSPHNRNTNAVALTAFPAPTTTR